MIYNFLNVVLFFFIFFVLTLYYDCVLEEVRENEYLRKI